MNTCLSPFDDVGRSQRRQVTKPQARALHLGVAELPRLDALGKFLVVANPLLRMLVHHRVFDADAIDRRIPEGRKQIGTFVQFSPHVFCRPTGRRGGQPADAGVAKPSAWRVRHHKQVPAVV
ncbi:hypothetical protein D3C86_1697140 [compost metagenome]